MMIFPPFKAWLVAQWLHLATLFYSVQGMLYAPYIRADCGFPRNALRMHRESTANAR